MKAKLMNIVLTAILVASLFFIAIQTSSSGEYDPWIDSNDDGEIDIFDAINLAAAFGTSGTPINKTEVLLELQNSVEQTKWIRFYNPNETTNSGEDWVTVSTFFWTPNNSSNNAILSIRCYFQFRMYEDRESPPFWIVTVNNKSSNIIREDIPPLGTYNWTGIYRHHDLYPGAGAMQILPNQDSYAIVFECAPAYAGETMYVKDLNILIEVIDGLPPSN